MNIRSVIARNIAQIADGIRDVQDPLWLDKRIHLLTDEHSRETMELIVTFDLPSEDGGRVKFDVPIRIPLRPLEPVNCSERPRHIDEL